MNTLVAGALLPDVARLHAQVQREQVACCQGITSTQCLILTELGRNGLMTLADVGRHLSLDKSWLSRAVDALTQEGLLTKQTGEYDRRAIAIALSLAGEARYQQLNTALNAQAERVRGRIPSETCQQAYTALQLLRQALLILIALPLQPHRHLRTVVEHTAEITFRATKLLIEGRCKRAWTPAREEHPRFWGATSTSWPGPCRVVERNCRSPIPMILSAEHHPVLFVEIAEEPECSQQTLASYI